MKCPSCDHTYTVNRGRCGNCGYPRICDWCKKRFFNRLKSQVDREYFDKCFWQFHGKPPYPFNEELEIKELTSNKSLWFICKECYERIVKKQKEEK